MGKCPLSIVTMVSSNRQGGVLRLLRAAAELPERGEGPARHRGGLRAAPQAPLRRHRDRHDLRAHEQVGPPLSDM